MCEIVRRGYEIQAKEEEEELAIAAAREAIEFQQARISNSLETLERVHESINQQIDQLRQVEKGKGKNKKLANKRAKELCYLHHFDKIVNMTSLLEDFTPAKMLMNEEWTKKPASEKSSIYLNCIMPLVEGAGRNFSTRLCNVNLLVGFFAVLSHYEVSIPMQSTSETSRKALNVRAREFGFTVKFFPGNGICLSKPKSWSIMDLPRIQAENALKVAEEEKANKENANQEKAKRRRKLVEYDDEEEDDDDDDEEEEDDDDGDEEEDDDDDEY